MLMKFKTRVQAKKNNPQSGYTLTELVVVIVVLGLVAAAVTPQVVGRFRRSKSQSALLQMQTLAAAVDMFYVDMGRYPTEAENIGALWTAPADGAGLNAWGGPYVREQKTLIDPWGEQFIYTPPDSVLSGYQLKSLGVDKVEGGTSDATDLTFPLNGTSSLGG